MSQGLYGATSQYYLFSRLGTDWLSKDPLNMWLLNDVERVVFLTRTSPHWITESSNSA